MAKRLAIVEPTPTPGDELVDSIMRGLPVENGQRWELSERDLAIIETARAQANDIDVLERELVAQGVMVPGSMGQPRLNPIVTELRLARASLVRILDTLRIPEPGEQVAKSRRHVRSAEQRWRYTNG